MNFETWWDHFDEDPYEKIGRYVPNVFGHQEIMHLTRIAWAYLDWLRDVEGCDIDRLFIDNDALRLPSDGCPHACMEGIVKTAFLRRELKGFPRPAWLPPAHPAELVDI
jgi:hypothetical protein